MAALAELFALAGGQVSEWSRPLSDRKVEAATDRSWPVALIGILSLNGSSMMQRSRSTQGTDHRSGSLPSCLIALMPTKERICVIAIALSCVNRSGAASP